MPVVRTKVCRNGNSAAITLPAEWRKAARVEIGDVVDVYYDDIRTLLVSKHDEQSDQRQLVLAELMGEVNGTPAVAWPDDSPDDDRAALEARYE